MKTSLISVLCLLSFLLTFAAHAGEVRIAVAANFTGAANEIGKAFTKQTGHKAVFSFGSTGQLYTQIMHGAPFEVFLAADQTRPALIVENGYASDQAFTYAFGQIALYSADTGLVADETTLTKGGFQKIAIANPQTAPYGVAAVETLRALCVYETLKTKIVQGANIAQTYQFVATGNAELGFVALSQIISHDQGSRWIVPQTVYTPIAQDAVLLKAGKDNEAARAFISYLDGPEASGIISRYGYGVPSVRD